MPARHWRRPALFLSAAVLGILALFHETFWSMVEIWRSSNTFSYGFLVFPIAAWLIWRQRRRLALLSPRPQAGVLGLILAAGCAWMLAHLVGARIPEQVAVIGLLILSFWSILGTAAGKVLLFPLGLMFFAVPLVPLQDALIRPMMDFTADVSVTLLRLSGLAVYQRDTFFSLASGNWEVAKTCSGIRYLLASVFLGSVYAYLNYRSALRRLLFIGFSLVVPVAANILRVYLIVIIGHLSDMKLAVGADHLLFGWVFFGLVIAAMFLVGSFWREPPEGENLTAAPQPAEPDLNGRNRFAGAFWATLLAAAVWPGIAVGIERIQVASNQDGPLQAPAGTAGWRAEPRRVWVWWPRIAEVDADFYKFYSKGDQTVSLYVGQFRSQHAAEQLTNSENVVVVKDRPVWQSNRRPGTRTVSLDDRPLQVIQSKTETPSRRTGGWHNLLIWHWYRFGGEYTSNPYVVRLRDLWSRLSGGRRDATLLLLAAPYEEDAEAAERILRSFAQDMLPEIEKALDRPVSKG